MTRDAEDRWETVNAHQTRLVKVGPLRAPAPSPVSVRNVEKAHLKISQFADNLILKQVSSAGVLRVADHTLTSHENAQSWSIFKRKLLKFALGKRKTESNFTPPLRPRVVSLSRTTYFVFHP